MKVWVKLKEHLHEGIGPGFPDRWVADGFDVRTYPFKDATECEVAVRYE